MRGSPIGTTPTSAKICGINHRQPNGVSLDNVRPLCYNSNYNKLKKEEQIMTITYSLWQGSNLLSVNNKASKPEEILAVIEELNKLGKGFTFNVREVDTK
jgi:hypothetical protein